MTQAEGAELQVSLPHQGSRLRYRSAGRASGARPRRRSCLRPARPGRRRARPRGMDRRLCGANLTAHSGHQGDASGGGAQAPGWIASPAPAGASWWGAPIPPAIDPGKPSRRGPWRPGRSYSGALHLDARNHARSTDVRAEGRRDGSRGGVVEAVEHARVGHEPHEAGHALRDPSGPSLGRPRPHNNGQRRQTTMGQAWSTAGQHVPSRPRRTRSPRGVDGWQDGVYLPHAAEPHIGPSRMPDGFSWLSTSTRCARRARRTATRSSSMM